ncbi:MAG: hypothetical protein JW937_08855 [Candidatus Omnitrophica bacterium]|nr:hypothetical protein [Candidatus Omnitrophota bacterium]
MGLTASICIFVTLGACSTKTPIRFVRPHYRAELLAQHGEPHKTSRSEIAGKPVEVWEYDFGVHTSKGRYVYYLDGENVVAGETQRWK